MKKTIALMTLVLSLGAFAQETVELSSKEVSIDASEVVVARTNRTPKEVEITLRVPLQKSVCERYETRHVLRTSGMHCGYETRIRRVRVGRVCTRTNPHNGECLRYADTFREERTQLPRTCMVPETYCATYGTAIEHKRDTVKIKFEKLPKLGDSESDTFSVKATQKKYDSSNVIYEIKPLQTVGEYKVSQKKFIGIKLDSYVVKEK